MIRIDNNKVYFYLEGTDNTPIPTNKWVDINLIFHDVLQTAFNNGVCEKNEYEYVITSKNIYLFEDTERDILGLPTEYPFDMYIEANENTLSQDDFKYKVSFYTFYPGGESIQYEIFGPFLQIKNIKYILSKDQYELYNAINEFNALPEKSRSKKNNYIHFSEIKELSNKASAKLDSYLNNTSVFLPDKIKILLDYHDSALSLNPSISQDNTSQFTEQYINNDEVSDIYTLKSKGGKRTRVILRDEQVQKLSEIKKKYSNISNAETINNIVSNPEKYFDSDTFDLSDFYSDRVIKIGIYKPKYYAFICPYKSEWIPGIKIEDNINGSTNLFFKNEQELDTFEKLVNESIIKGEKSINWNNAEINTANILSCIPAIRDQLRNPDKKNPSKKNNAINDVLIIQENAEQLGYAVDILNADIIEQYTFTNKDILNKNIKLKSHQIEGIAWMQYLINNNYRGCLLADDMGLGKTLQILYLLQWHWFDIKKSNKPYLIVAPISLLGNWEKEYIKFFKEPRMNVSIINSQNTKKIFDKKEVEYLQSKELIITNYETVRLCQLNFCAVDYAVVVLDEAQKAKTPGTLITNSVKALKADFKIAVTGTPVENTLIDLWSILDFSVPGLLGTAKAFAQEYQNPLKDQDIDIENIGRELRSKLGIYFKRRLKTDIADELPSKKIFKIEKEMPIFQENRYKEELNAVIKVRNSGKMMSGFMFKVISALRRISDNPFLAESNIDMYSSKDIINSSAKLLITIDLLNEIKQRGEKVIIFTDYKETQRMLYKVIFETMNINSIIINGDTPSIVKLNSQHKSRQDAIDEFQSKSGFNIIIMSPLAAGIGLNITGANNVIHYSRFWNPAKENQATDRAYRIGQDKDVNVYYPMAICKDFMTFDKTIDNLLSKKSSLIDATLFPSSRIEVKQQELYESLFNKEKIEIDQRNLNIENVDRLDNYSFEAFTAALYIAQGYRVYLTPFSNDKGVDVIAIGRDKCFVIQVKHSINKVGNEGVYEVCGGKKYYENKYNINSIPILLCNSYFTTRTIDLANHCSVKLINREELIKMMNETPLSFENIEASALQRMDTC
jgi:SNF2 family DNA or RNA helicase